MVIISRGNRLQHLSTDTSSLPTTGVTANSLAENCSDNTWRYFNGTSSTWVLLGTNTLSPLFAIPGDVIAQGTAGSSSSSMSPNAPFWWNNGDGQGNLGGTSGILPFSVTTSKTIQDYGYLPGQKLLETDTGNWFRWDGDTWVRDQSGAVVGSTSASGGNIEKGGGIFVSAASTNGQTVYNIPHGMGAIPTIFLVCPASQAANSGSAATTTMGYVVTADATNIIVTYGQGQASNNVIKFNWIAIN